MLKWDGDSVSNANLNKTAPGGWDAIVKGDVGTPDPNGYIYSTVAAALSAGHKNILVLPGTYAGFTVSGAGVHITASSIAYWNGSAFSGGVIFTSTITIGATDVVLEGISVKVASGNGITVAVTCTKTKISSCQCCGCAGTGLNLVGTNTFVLGGMFVSNTYDGIYVAGNGSRIIGILAYSNGSDGIEIAASIAFTTIVACQITGSTVYGINVGATQTRCIVVGCSAIGTSGGINGTPTAEAGNVET